MKHLTHALYCATILLSAALPVRAGGEDYLLTVDEFVPTGEVVEICMTTSSDTISWLLVSMDPGPLDTPYGSLDVGLPLLFIEPFFIGAGQTMCCATEVPCEADFIGLTGYMQFVAFHTDGSGTTGLSNPVTMTIELGSCTDPGDYFSYSQGGWGTSCSGGGMNPGCLRDEHFDSVFPSGLVAGDLDGPDADGLFTLLLTSSLAVETMMPNGGSAASLTANETDPGSSAAGILAGQLVAAILNVGFDDFGVFDDLKENDTILLGDLYFIDGVDAALLGLTVREVIALGNEALSGDVSIPLGDLVVALEIINVNFHTGDDDDGNLGLIY